MNVITGTVFNPYRVFNGSYIPNGLMRCAELSSSAKLIWARLAQFAGEDGQAYPSQQTLAIESGVSRRAVQYCLDELVRLGFLKVIRPENSGRLNHSTSVYEFTWHECLNQSMSERPEAQKLRTPGAKIAPGINNVVEVNQLRESPPIVPQGGTNSPSGPFQKDNDLMTKDELAVLFKELGETLVKKSAFGKPIQVNPSPPDAEIIDFPVTGTAVNSS